jgi:hypothetical protein
MYNTRFLVKYNTIEHELLNKEEFKEDIDVDSSSDEGDYSRQDVLDICTKLYVDELLSVFGADSVTDPEIETTMNNIYDEMLLNQEFKKVMTDIEKECAQKFLNSPDSVTQDNPPENNSSALRQIIIDILFSQHLFYITHQCICQQLELGSINIELLSTFNTQFRFLLFLTEK